QIDGVADEIDMAVAVQHVQPPRVSAAKAKGVGQAKLVLQRQRGGNPVDVVVVADVHRLVVPAVRAGQVVLRVEVLLAEVEGVARSPGDVAKADLTAAVNDARDGGVRRVAPAVGRRGGQVGRAAVDLVGPLAAGAGRVIGAGELLRDEGGVL